MSEPLPSASIVGTWRDPQAFLATCAAARDAGFRATAFAPFPVHGLETAMGHPPSKLGRIVLLAIVIGAIGCWNFLYATSVDGWPINTSGMPFNSPLFWVVCILETALLTGAVVNLAACFHVCKLVPGDAAVVDPRATDDLFCLVLPVCGERYTADSLTRWLDGRGAESVTVRAEPAHA